MTEPVAGNADCDFCGSPITTVENAVGVMLTEWMDEDGFQRFFCSWEHAQAWFAKTDREEFGQLVEQFNRQPGDWTDSVFKVGCLLVFAILIVLIVTGAGTILGEIF